MLDTYTQHPASIIIFGGTGDLAVRSLYPSLFSLFERGLMPQDFVIVSFSFADIDRIEMQSIVRARLQDLGIEDTDIIEQFVDRIYFFHGSFTELDDFTKLREFVGEITHKVCTSKLLYLSAPPQFFDDLVTNINESGLGQDCDPEWGWVRVAIEKPFGHDHDSAQALSHLVHDNLQHEQVFHVDHFLNKEMMSSIMFFRFSNAIFEPAWHNEHVSRIDIRFNETLDVSNRGSFYDQVGAFRDVGQNHMLEMLALSLMRKPGALNAEEVTTKRAEALASLSLVPGNSERWQYDGYRDTDGVKDNSETETYFRIQLQSDMDCWKRVPLYLSGGKAQGDADVSVTITFNDSSCLCAGEAAQHRTHANQLIFAFKPEAGVRLVVWNKEPGLDSDLEKVNFVLPHEEDHEHHELLNTYERVFYDIIRGDHTLFVSDDEITHGWKISDQILDTLQQTPLQTHVSGENIE